MNDVLKVNFYKQYKWSPKKEEDLQFVGRKYIFEDFWDNIGRLTHHKGRKNRAFIGQRKLGKTALFLRMYNITFWEQKQVIPFYFCFPQREKLELNEIVASISMTLLQQALAYITKDENIIAIEDAETMFAYIGDKKYPWLKLLTLQWPKLMKRIEQKNGESCLEEVWNLVSFFARIFKKKSLLIIDEAQQMEAAIYEKDKLISCRGSIAKVIIDTSVLTYISGSKISMLAYEFLDYYISNRFIKYNFHPLVKEEAFELMKLLLPKNSYSGIQEDLFNLTKGNPFYIKAILAENPEYNLEKSKKKSFSSFVKLKEIYDFEVLNRRGTIYQFWQEHFLGNAHLLNGDPKGKKGLTIQILHKIAKSNDYIYFDELRKEFAIKDVKSKMEQLRTADLIDYQPFLERVEGFRDPVLAVSIANIYADVLFPGDRDEQLQKEINEISGLNERIQQLEKNTQQQITAIKNSVVNLDKKVKSAVGKINLVKGRKKEGTIRRRIRIAIQKKKGIFSAYKLEGKVQNAYISTSSGKGCEIDIFAKLKKGRKTVAVIGEVKERKKKVNSTDVKKFVNALALAKIEFELKNCIAIYISTSGFTKPAQKLLEQYNIRFSENDRVFCT